MRTGAERVARLQRLIAAGQAAEALAECRELVAFRPRSPNFHHLLGTALAALGDVAGALDSYDAALDLRITFQSAQADLCALLARRGQATGRYPITVITPTIGTAHLARAIASVQAQSYGKVEHLVVVDGPDGAAAAERAVPAAPRHPVHLLRLPFNTGAGGFNGHRIYGAAVYLVSGRYVAFLDEDNAFEPDHLAKMMDLIEANGLQWAHSLRRVVDTDGRVVDNDDCECLGRWPSWEPPHRHVIDTSCYLVRRDIAIRFSPVFHRRFRDEVSPDIALCDLLLRHAPDFGCSGAHSVLYTVGRSETSVSHAFFTHGNALMRQRYGERPPWHGPTLTRDARQGA